jgi:hypothetical protein
MIRRTVAALAFLALGACSSMPPLDFTVTPPIAPATAPIDAKVASISVDRAPGATKKEVPTDDLAFPLWKESLSNALAQAKLFSDASGRNVKITVQVSNVHPPAFGLEMVTTSTAKYDVVDAASGAVLFSKTVEARGVVPGDYAFVGMVRAQESINRSVRNSISEFIEALKAASPMIKAG